MSTHRMLLVIVGVMLPSSTAVGLPVTVTGWDLGTTIYGSPWGSDGVSHTRPALPFSHQDTATRGASTSTSIYDFTVSPNQVLFDFQFDHAHGPAYLAGAGSHGWVDFTVAEDLTYSFAGTYAIQGTDLRAIEVALRDLTTAEYVFVDRQESGGAFGSVLTLREAGFFQTWSVGEPVGALIAGHRYRMQYSYGISYWSGSGLSQTATGVFQFAITPEPSALLLLAPGALALLRRRRR